MPCTTTPKVLHLRHSTSSAVAGRPSLRPQVLKSSSITTAKRHRGQRRCLHASFGPTVEPVIALDVEFVHLRYAAIDTWTIVPGEVAVVADDGILLHTYIHPGKICRHIALSICSCAASESKLHALYACCPD